MTGKQLKELLFKSEVSQSEIARRLGISHQSLNQMLSAADVKSGTIERIADALGVGMSFFYPMEGGNTVASVTGNVAVTGNNNVAGNVSIGDAAILQERVALLEKLLEEKERTIKILMEK